MDTSPEVRAVTDGKERAFRRPVGWGNQERFHPGKKKRHAVKNRVVCAPSGRIGSVGRPAPGRTHDPTTLRHDRVLDRLPTGAGAMTDKGYVGVRADAGERPVVIPVRATKNRPLTDDREFGSRAINRERVVVEHVMAQSNRFRVLRQTFRSAFGRHTRVFRVVALLADRRIAVTPLETYPPAA